MAKRKAPAKGAQSPPVEAQRLLWNSDFATDTPSVWQLAWRHRLGMCHFDDQSWALMRELVSDNRLLCAYAWLDERLGTGDVADKRRDVFLVQLIARGGWLPAPKRNAGVIRKERNQLAKKLKTLMPEIDGLVREANAGLAFEGCLDAIRYLADRLEASSKRAHNRGFKSLTVFDPVNAAYWSPLSPTQANKRDGREVLMKRSITKQLWEISAASGDDDFEAVDFEVAAKCVDVALRRRGTKATSASKLRTDMRKYFVRKA